MGFWEYPDTASDDEDSGSPNAAILKTHRSPKLSRSNTKTLSDLDYFGAKQKLTKKQAIAIPDEEEEDGIPPPRKKKRKSVLKRISLEQECVSGQPTEEAARLQKLRAQAMQAFADDDEDDEDNEDLENDLISEQDEQNARAGHVQMRAPVMYVEDVDDEEEVEAELAAEQILLRQGADATSGANTMVLKVQCKHGHVQIRQQIEGNFVELMQKFRAHAVKQNWAKKSSKMILECDGDAVDLKNSTPEEFELEDDTELATLYGLATPPTSYGGYGGNVKEDPKYKFDYPETWKQLTVNKVQKGTQGIDCIVQEGRNKQSRAFVVTLSRAGEDNKSFKLTDLDQTFQSFVGADYDLQDAVATADEITSGRREVNGQLFYDYLVPGDSAVYRACITVSGGKVFALFVSSPAKAFKGNQATIDKMIESFRTL